MSHRPGRPAEPRIWPWVLGLLLLSLAVWVASELLIGDAVDAESARVPDTATVAPAPRPPAGGPMARVGAPV